MNLSEIRLLIHELCLKLSTELIMNLSAIKMIKCLIFCEILHKSVWQEKKISEITYSFASFPKIHFREKVC